MLVIALGVTLGLITWNFIGPNLHSGLYYSESRHDFGLISQSPHRFTFYLTNTELSNKRIYRVLPTCGCTQVATDVKLPANLTPLHSILVTATLDAKGAHDEPVSTELAVETAGDEPPYYFDITAKYPHSQ